MFDDIDCRDPFVEKFCELGVINKDICVSCEYEKR